MLKVGCCGFPLAKKQYAALFSVAEVQTTFYQPPRVSTLQRWRAEAPPEFEFTLKAWQLITHSASSPTYRRVTTDLSESERLECGSFQPTAIVQDAWLTTRACAEALSARCVLFQCPPSFGPTEANLTNMRRFFTELERHSLRVVWEPRGTWPDMLVESLCRELNLIHAVDPFLRRTVTREFIYYRLHGGKDFRHRFDDTELRQLTAVIPADKPAYVLFNNVAMLENGLHFQEMVQGEAVRKVA
jgi:uncharacterized protein YecE (DUF72 family)